MFKVVVAPHTPRADDAADSTPTSSAQPSVAVGGNTNRTLADCVDALPCAIQQRIALMANYTNPAVVAELNHAFVTSATLGCELMSLYLEEECQINGGLHELSAVNVCAVQYVRRRFGALCQIMKHDHPDLEGAPSCFDDGVSRPWFNLETTTDELRKERLDGEFGAVDTVDWADDFDLNFTAPADPAASCARWNVYCSATSFHMRSDIQALRAGGAGGCWVSGGLTPARPPLQESMGMPTQPPALAFPVHDDQTQPIDDAVRCVAAVLALYAPLIHPSYLPADADDTLLRRARLFRHDILGLAKAGKLDLEEPAGRDLIVNAMALVMRVEADIAAQQTLQG